MEFTFSAQGPERAAVFVCPTGAWPPQSRCDALGRDGFP